MKDWELFQAIETEFALTNQADRLSLIIAAETSAMDRVMDLGIVVVHAQYQVEHATDPREKLLAVTSKLEARLALVCAEIDLAEIRSGRY